MNKFAILLILILQGFSAHAGVGDEVRDMSGVKKCKYRHENVA
jgi:hypothetical protein